jgi:hypothetical protein
MKLTAYQKLRIEYLWRTAAANGDPLECVYCGEDSLAKLTAGHKMDNGAVHRHLLVGPLQGRSRRGGGATGAFMRALQLRDWPKSQLVQMQLECWNCNCAKKSSLDGVTITDYIEEVADGVAERSEARDEPVAWKKAARHRP